MSHWQPTDPVVLRRWTHTKRNGLAPAEYASAITCYRSAEHHAARWIFAALAVVAGLLAFAHWGLN